MQDAVVMGMVALRKHTSCALLSITSTPASPPPWFGAPEVDLTIVADPVGEDAAAVAIASMCRPRRAEHEEVWAQLFIDGVFVDVVRAADVSDGYRDDGIATFLARVRVPALYFDGESHHAQVKFVDTISRVVPRGTGVTPVTEIKPEVSAAAEFAAVMARAR